MDYETLNIIGLMTGTSMDGIDISLVKTNGISLETLDENYYYEYNNKTKDLLLNLHIRKLENYKKNKQKLDALITKEHYKALITFNIINKCEIIGFHGQTIFHDPKEKISIQAGDPQLLANLTKKNVVFDFRSQDMELGGQGAPLAPVYHKLLIQKLKLKTPSCILNIGGVTNITYWDGINLIGFDTGPGNALIDKYIRSISNKYFDKNGYLASKGIPNKEIIKKVLNNSFFKSPPPKSLDKHTFENFYNELIDKNFSTYDTISTLTEFTVESIVHAFNFLPQNIKNIVVTGGGYKNLFLMKRLKEKLKLSFLKEKDLRLKFDYIESELIAYLSARSIYKLPFTFPSTTGVSKALSGGKLYKYL